jgi:hypothetical protein
MCDDGKTCSNESGERWKLDVNKRYQKAVGTVISLSSAALLSPIVFLRDVVSPGEHNSIVSLLTWSAYSGWILLGVSIVSGVLYYFFSAKWVKMALGHDADIFWYTTNPTFVEWALDLTYFAMMIGFLGGMACMLGFMATYVRPT